ncbi:lipopolysaccharide biosynthesis protein [Micromonospora trifolii]|uniref:lipopolysaccharide biosynthesis protein n=1 Tax=Micromonospora trifolii TaxID=2911208 RepID=UPI003CE8F818
MTRSLIDPMRRVVGSATMMYLSALAMSGVAILLSVALPPAERGLLVATTTSATIGVAIGGLSLETFLLAQGRRWLDEVAGRRSLVIYVATVPLTAVLAWIFAHYSEEAVPSIAVVGAACIAASNIPAAAGLTLGQFLSVYRYRAAFAAVAPALYVLLILAGVKDAELWLLAWLGCQALMAVALWVKHGVPLSRMARRASPQAERLNRLGLTHSGAVAQVFTYRFDQLALARYQGPDVLAVYSLAVAAIEFTQAGAVVAAQRTLGDHEDGSAQRLYGMLRRALYLAVGMGMLVLVGLAGIGVMTNGYEAALLVGLVLLARSTAVTVGKVLSARLVNLGGERATALIAAGTALAAVVGYSLTAPEYGAMGVAIVSVVLFALHSTVTAVVLKKRPDPQIEADPQADLTNSKVGNVA